MKNPIAVVNEIYKYPDMFDEKAFSTLLQKVLQKFLQTNAARGLNIFAKVERGVFDTILDVAKPSDLRNVLAVDDPAWLKSKASVAVMKAHILARVYGDAEPPPDRAALAKSAWKTIKDAKTIEDWRASYGRVDDSAICKLALSLATEAQVTTLVRRFDKYNLSMIGEEKAAKIVRLDHLGTEHAAPFLKPIKKLRTAASKAKWSGSEPD